jgi:sensor domain CHASE-containing protein
VVVVIDQQGRTIYSAIGFDQDTFVERLTAAIDGARQPPH